MFVLAVSEGERRGVVAVLLVPVFLSSPFQGVQPRPGGRRAPMAPRVENLAFGDAAPVPTSPQTFLAVRESIWVGEGIKEEIYLCWCRFHIFGHNNQILQSSSSPSRSIWGGTPSCRCSGSPEAPVSSSVSGWPPRTPCSSSPPSSSSPSRE